MSDPSVPSPLSSQADASPTPLQQRLAAAAPWVSVGERDLLYMRVDEHQVLVVASDSDGGIGPKPADTVAADAVVLGRFAVRVPLLEMIAAGATPVIVVDTLAVEKEPTGFAILEGVLIESRAAGVDDSAVTGSTEDNVPTVATGVGVTVIGRAQLSELRAGTARCGDAVVLVGHPKSAPADVVVPDDPDIIDVASAATIVGLDAVHEALPIGSGGVGHEFTQLAKSCGLTATPRPDWPVAPTQSGGPSTAMLIAVAGGEADAVVEHIQNVLGLPAWILGDLS